MKAEVHRRRSQQALLRMGEEGKGAPRTSRSSPTSLKKPSSTRSKAPPGRRPLSSSIWKAPPSMMVAYRIADAQGWVLGETLEPAVAALKREIAAQIGRASCRGRGENSVVA